VASLLSNIAAEVAERGFTIARKFASEAVVAQLLDDLASIDHGARGLLVRGNAVAAFASTELVLETMRTLVGREARAVRAFVLDKRTDANWGLGWHQDITVAVQKRHAAVGFEIWSEKDGVTHVRPPVSVLERMASLRLHLDDAPLDCGPLLVAVGTHRRGIIAAEDVRAVTQEVEIFSCDCKAGDAVIARPLLLHASRRSRSSARRRILHIEFAGSELPEPLRWHPF